jgi:hypothetical protein
VHRVKQWLREVKVQKHVKFRDLDRIVQRCLSKYGVLFPHHKIGRDGSKTVYHFNVAGLTEISLEKEHGSREYLPKPYVKLALANIEDLLNYIDLHSQELDITYDRTVVNEDEDEVTDD